MDAHELEAREELLEARDHDVDGEGDAVHVLVYLLQLLLARLPSRDLRCYSHCSLEVCGLGASLR